MNKEKLYFDLANYFIDSMCENDGVVETIVYLIYHGLDDNELLFLNFDKESIENARDRVKENEKEYGVLENMPKTIYDYFM